MPDELTAPKSPGGGNAAGSQPGARPAAELVAPPLGPPRDPAGSGATTGGRRFRPAALGVALLVLLIGIAVGGGMFALEQSSVTWRPNATSTASGWRIAGPHGLPIQDAALSSGHLAWVSGPYTVVFDLSAGRSKLLGIARRTSAAPAVSGQYTAWLDEAPGGSARPSIWAYRFATSVRRRLDVAADVVAAPALSGSTLVWAGRPVGAGGSAAAGDVAIVARDLTSGAGSIIASGPEVTYPVVADWPRVGWGENATASGSQVASYYFAVKDVRTDQTYRVDLLAGARSATLMDIALSGTTLVWRLRTADGSGEILLRDLTGGTTQPVASGPGLSGGSIDGGRVVWSQPGTGGTSIMCLRLSGGGSPAVVATVASGTVTDVLVGGDTVAWIVEGAPGGFNGIETGRLAP